MGIALHNHLVRQLYRAGFRHPASVVAAQIDQHQMLGDFLGVGQQFRFHGPVFGIGGATLSCAGDRAHGDFVIFHPRQDFRR